MTEKYTWAKQTQAVDAWIEASHDPIKEWNQDPSGYFLIRLHEERIEAAFVTNDHVIKKVVHGTNAIAIYNTIIREKLISRLEHGAYLGKELYKAELALRYGKKYVQEAPLNFSDQEVVKITLKS